jgi:competence protein ComEC
MLVEFPDSTNMMIDAGDKLYALPLMNYLKSLNISKIDTAIITHPHVNHFQGFFNIAEILPIGRMFINGDDNAEEGYFELLEGLKQKQIPVEILRGGQTLDQMPLSVDAQILYPIDLKGSPNGNSIVLWLKYKEISILFTGDVEQKEQEELIAIYEEIKEADCIKVPHHGGPLSDAFTEAFVEKIFVISTGPNQWNWPQPDDFNRLQGEVLRTDVEGTVVLKSFGKTIEVDQ